MFYAFLQYILYISQNLESQLFLYLVYAGLQINILFGTHLAQYPGSASDGLSMFNSCDKKGGAPVV